MIDGALVLRVDDINPEMGPSFPIPLLSIYEDGSVVMVVQSNVGDEYVARYARLTPAGLGAVLAEAGDGTDLRTGTAKGDRFAGLATWLAPESWEVWPGDDVTWVPDAYMLSIRVHDGHRSLVRDVDDAWPLNESFATFGEPVAGDDPIPPDRPLRCGVVDLDDALALASAGSPGEPTIPSTLNASVSLSWDRESASAELVLEALLPDEPRSCEMAQFFP